MSRADKRRLARGMKKCPNGHWYKPIFHGKERDCPKCRVPIPAGMVEVTLRV